jgi:poly(A) polymerase
MSKTDYPLPTKSEPVILTRSEHPISRKHFDEATLKVLYRLHRSGHKGYLVGGSIRDLLLGRTPKDFDVGTDATPNQVRKLFRNCFLVGRRFRLAHVRFGPDTLIEVATFRRLADESDLPTDSETPRFTAENVFGTPREDAFRRDFTINAMFYNIEDFSIIDYVGGLRDLSEKRIRMIGDPLVRFEEDPVRMLRALEFAARLEFTIDPETLDAIPTQAHLLATASPARLREEMMELFRHKVASAVLHQAGETGILTHLLPNFLHDEACYKLLDQIDARTLAGTPINEGFAIAALYLENFRRLLADADEFDFAAIMHLANTALSPHIKHFQVSHGIQHQAREMFLAFRRFQRGRGRKGERRFLRHPATSQALELYELWCQTGAGDLAEAADWREAIEQSGKPVEKSTEPNSQGEKRRRPRRRKKRPAKPDADQSASTTVPE